MAAGAEGGEEGAGPRQVKAFLAGLATVSCTPTSRQSSSARLLVRRYSSRVSISFSLSQLFSTEENCQLGIIAK